MVDFIHQRLFRYRRIDASAVAVDALPARREQLNVLRGAEVIRLEGDAVANLPHGVRADILITAVDGRISGAGIAQGGRLRVAPASVHHHHRQIEGLARVQSDVAHFGALNHQVRRGDDINAHRRRAIVVGVRFRSYGDDAGAVVVGASGPGRVQVDLLPGFGKLVARVGVAGVQRTHRIGAHLLVL